MRIALSWAAVVAALCLWLNAAFFVAGQFGARVVCYPICLYSQVGYVTGCLTLVGVLALSVMAILAAIHAGEQHAWTTGVALLLLVGLSIWGTFAIFSSNELSYYRLHLTPLADPNGVGPWMIFVLPALLLALAALPALVLSWFPLRRTPPWYKEGVALAALVSLIVAGAALWFFQFGFQQLFQGVPIDVNPPDEILAAAPRFLGTLTLFLVCWLVGNITLMLSLLRRMHAPAVAVSA
jgi:hypothetical protein